MTATRRITIRLTPTVVAVATVAAVWTGVIPLGPVLLLVSLAAVVGGTWVLATLAHRDTIAELRAELVTAADDLTLMEAQRFAAELRADRAEAAWHALLSGRDQSEAGS